MGMPAVIHSMFDKDRASSAGEQYVCTIDTISYLTCSLPTMAGWYNPTTLLHPRHTRFRDCAQRSRIIFIAPDNNAYCRVLYIFAPTRLVN